MSRQATDGIQFVDAGFFPKEVVEPKGWLAEHAPGVERVCSVSRCISDGPSGWLDHWIHNELGLFATPDQARSVVLPSDAPHIEIHGYRLGTIAYDEGRPVPAPLQAKGAAPIPASAEFLGYDAVGNDFVDFPECSPLSCNGGAGEFGANRWCLLSTVEEAAQAAARFSSEDWEPGVYYVVEVWRLGGPATPQPESDTEQASEPPE